MASRPLAPAGGRLWRWWVGATTAGEIVGLSSVGMFAGGGISAQPRFVDGRLRDRELLSVTLSCVDGVDGAPAARFANRLGSLLERARGLDDAGNGRS